MCFMLLSLYDGSSGKSGQNAGLPYCLTVVFVVTSALFLRKPRLSNCFRSRSPDFAPPHARPSRMLCRWLKMRAGMILWRSQLRDSPRFTRGSHVFPRKKKKELLIAKTKIENKKAETIIFCFYFGKNN